MRRDPAAFRHLFAAVAVILVTSVIPPPRADAASVEASTAARLSALGYVDEVIDDPDPKLTGVTRRDARAFSGINYHCTGQSVRFFDMDGALVHEMPLEIGTGGDAGCLAKVYRPGLMTVVRSPVLSLSGVRGGSRWYHGDDYHHDVASDASGRVYGLARYDGALRRGERTVPVLGQRVVVFDGKGRLQRAIDLVPLFGPLVPESRLDAIVKGIGTETPETRETVLRTRDVFHPNTIDIVAWPHAAGGTRSAALIALRDLDRVAAVDLEQPKILWEWGAHDIVGPHDPWLLGDGNVLLFDNGARPMDAVSQRTSSRVVEVDPRTGRIVWQYPAEPSPRFFSPTRGGAQPLPNGNVLITESTKGHVFEVTRQGDVVWDFWNPEFREKDGLRRTIYRMRRMSLEEFEKLRR